MAAGVYIQESVMDTLRREDEIEKLVDQASNITLVKIAVEGNIGGSHTPVEPPDMLETDFEVRDSVKGNEGSASTLEGEKFFKSPSGAEVYFEENNLAPDACQVNKNAGKMVTEHETDASHVGEATLDAEESNGLEKGLVSVSEVPATREVGYVESIPVHEAGLPENKEDRKSTILEKNGAHTESFNVNPEDTKTCVMVHDTETTSSVEEKRTSTSQEIPGEKIEQSTFDTNQETPEHISTIVPNEETKQNLSIEVDDSQMKTDEKLEKEDEKPGSTLIPEGQIKDEESTQNELFETKNETETVIQKCEEVIEKGVESSPAASEAEDIEASTSDHDTETSAQNPLEIEADKSECKPGKETPEEQVEDVSTLSSMTGKDDSVTKDEAHLEKEGEKPCFTDASTRDASHDDTTPVDKAKTEDEEPSISDLFGDKEDTESTILVEEPIIEKHLESLSAVPDDIKACELVQDTEAKGSIKEKLPSATPQAIWGDKLERTALDTNEETPEDISTNVSNEETEQNSIVEVPFVAEALTTDNELAITKGKIKDEDQMEKYMLENNNGTESELLKQEVTEKPVESLQLANEAEETKVSTLVHDKKISVLENQIPTEKPLEIEVDKSECKPEKEIPEEQVEDVPTLSSMTGEDESLTKDGTHSDKESEKPCFTDDETTPVDKATTEDEEPRKSGMFENKEGTESTILVEEPIMEKHLESLSAAPDDIKACALVQDTETKSSTEEKLPTATPQEIWGDKIEQTTFDTKVETPEDISTNASNEETEQSSIVEVPFVTEALTTDKELAITKGKIKDEDQREKDLLKNNNGTESELLKQEVTEETVESFQLASEAEDTKMSTSDHNTETSALENQILTENAQETVADETESKPCDVVDTKNKTLDVQDVSTIESNDNNEENSVIEEDESVKPLFREEPTRDAAGDESTYTNEDKNEGEDQRRAELFENSNSTESMSLIEDNTILKLVESPQVDAEDIKTRVLDQDAETAGLILASEGKSNDAESAVKYEFKTEDDDQKEDQLCDNEKYPESNVLLEASQFETPIETLQQTPQSKVPQGFLDDKTEEKTVDVIQKDKEILDVQHDISTIVLNDDHEETSVIGEDDSQMTNEENLGEEIKKPSSTEASRTDASRDESTNKHEDKSEGEEHMKAELFEDKEDTESTFLKEEETAAPPLESPQVDVKDINTYVSDQGTKTTILVGVFEGVANDNEPEVKRNEDGDENKVELCDTENIPNSALRLEAEHMEKPFESSKEALSTLVPHGFPDENIEENATTNVSKENTEADSVIQVDGSQIHCKEYSEEEKDRTSIIEALTKNNDDNSVNVYESSGEHEGQRKHEYGDTKITSQEEEAQIVTPVKSSNTAAEDIIASDSCQETEITSSQEEQTLNEEETVCDQLEVETHDTADTKMQTSEAQDVSTIVPNDDSGENSETENNDLQMKTEEIFGKETKKPSVTEASTTDASGDDSANNCDDKVDSEEQIGAELFKGKKYMESKLLKEEEIMVRLVESPKEDSEDIKTYISDEGAETTGTVEASQGDADNDEYAVKNEVKTEDKDKKDDELSDNGKNTESELLEAVQTEKPIESLQETLPSTVPRGFLEDNTEEKTVDALQKDEDVKNFKNTVSNEKIEENTLIEMDSSHIQHEGYLEKEHEIPSVIEALTKHANDDELIVHEDNIDHEDPRKVEFESEKDTEINLQEDDTQIVTHSKPSQVAAEDIIAKDSYQGMETTDSQEERGLNENAIVHEEKEVERFDAADTKKETPEVQDVSTFLLNDDNEENLVIGEDDSEMKNEENLGKESKNPSSVEASPMDASGDEPTKNCEDKIEGEEHMRADDTGCTFLKEVETVVQPLESPQVDAEDINTYVSDQGTETACLVEVFEEAANDNQPEVKFTIKTEDKEQKEDESCDNENIPDCNLPLEVADTEKAFESLKEALPTSVPRGFSDERTEEKVIDATEKDEEGREIQNTTIIVSNDNLEDDSLIQVDGSQMQCKECSEVESERTTIIDSSTKNVNDDNSINVHEDITEHKYVRKDELVVTKEDTKITPQKEEAPVEAAVKSLQIVAEDIIESDSCQETETMSSQEDRFLNEEEIVREQIEVQTLDTADTETKTPEAQDVSTILPNDDSEAKSMTGEDDLHMRNEENLGKESRKPSVIEASTKDASGDESTNKHEGEEQIRAEMFVDKKDMESALLKEKDIIGKLVESPHVDTEKTKTYVSDEGAGNDQNEDKLCDNAKNPESAVLVEAAQIESLQESLPSTVPREFLEDKTMDAVEKDKEILDIQNVAKSVSNEKIEDYSLVQAGGSQIQHEKYLEKEFEVPYVIEASTKHANDDELISIHEDNTEYKDLKKVELQDTEINLQKDEGHMETSVKSSQVAAEDIIASDSYHETETTSQEEQLVNENEIVHEQKEVERLDTADSDKQTPEAKNFAIIFSSENIKKNSQIPEDGSEQKHLELPQKESRAPPFSETLTMEAKDEVPEVIHQDRVENEKLKQVDKFEFAKHEEIILLNEAPAEKLDESSKEDLEDIKDIVSVANAMERSLIEVQSLNENHDHMDENIVNKDPEEIEDDHLDKDVKFENEKHIEIDFIKEEESVDKLQEPEKKDLEEIKAFVSHEGTETICSIEERDSTEISQESVGDPLEDKILAEAREIPDFTPIVPGEPAEKNSSTQPDGLQVKREELSDKECEMLSTPETSFLYSSSNEPMTVDLENTENGHLKKFDKFEDDKHTKIAITNDKAPVEEPQECSRRDIEEVKAFGSWEGEETSSVEEQGLTEISPEIMSDKLEEKILDNVGTTREFTKFVSDEHGEVISLLLVDDRQIKHEELSEKESEASLLSETSLQNSNFNQDKIEDELVSRVDKFESEKHVEIILIKEEAPLEKLNKSSLRKDPEEIKAFDISEDTETSSTGERNLTAIPQENEFTTVNASQIKHEELLERQSETPPTPLLHSSNGKSAVVHTGKIEDEILEKADKFECMESGEATLLNEEVLAEKITKYSKDLEGIKESITGDGTEITSSREEQNLITISQENIDDQIVEKVLDAAGEASDSTTIIPDNNTERILLVKVDASQMKHEERLEKESEIPSLLMLNISSEEPTTVHDNKVMEHAEIILSNEEALENSSKEENENTRPSVACEDTEKSSIEQESLIANSHEIVGDQVKEKIIDVAQNAPDLTPITSDENAEENSLIPLDGSQIKHEEPLEKETETPSMSMLDATTEESTILQGRIIDDQDVREVDKFECEKETEATLLKEPTPAEKVAESAKDDPEDTKVFLSCEEKGTVSSIEEQSQKANQQEITVDQTQENVLDSATKAQDFKQTVSHEYSGENSLIQADESQVKHEIVSDQTQENVLDTAPKDQDFKPTIAHENAENNSLIQVDEIQKKHDALEKESETPSLLMVDSSNEESRIIYEDITEDENLQKFNDFESEKHEEINSTEDETRVTKVNESSKEDLEDIKALVSGEDSETTSFEEKQSLNENPSEILMDQQEEKILDIAPETQESKIIVLDEKTEEKSSDQVDKSQTKHEELLEKESKTLSLSETSLLNTSNEDSTTINDDKVEDEGPEKVDKIECEKHTELPLTKEEEPGQKLNHPLKEDIEEIKAFGSCPDTETSSTEDQSLQINPQEVMGDQMEENIIDTTPEPQNFTALVSDENIKDNLSLYVDESQIKHEALLVNESEKPSLSILKTSNEESSIIRDSKTKNEHVKRDEKAEQLKDLPKEGPENIKVSVPSENLETGLTENPQENLREDKELDIVPEALELKTIESDKNTEENPIILEDGSEMKHEEHSKKESEKPSLTETSVQNTRNEETTPFLDDKIEDEDQAKVKESECDKHAEITEVPVENPNSSNLENIEAFVSCEDIEPTNSTEGQCPSVNPKENVGGQKVEQVLDKALEAPDFAPIVPDDNNDDNPSIQVNGSQMKHEEPLEKESKVASLLETSLLNTNNEVLETIDNDKIVAEALKHVDDFESLKCSEVHKLKEEVQVEEYVSHQDTEASVLQEQILTANPQDISENNFIDTAVSKEKNKENFPVSNVNVVKDSLIQTDESETKHEEILEKEAYSAKTSTVKANEELTTIHKDMIGEESGKILESTLLNEGSLAYESVKSLQVVSEDIKASVTCLRTDTVCSKLNADPQEETAGDQTDDKINAAGTREITLEALILTTLVSNEDEVLDSITPRDGLEIVHEETTMLADNEEPIIIHEDTINGEDLNKFDTFKSVQQTENTLSKEEAHMDSLQVASEPIKASVSCQDRDPTSSSREQILTTIPQIVCDQVEGKVTDTAKTWEETPEVSSSILVSQEDEANIIGDDDINSVMVKDEETLNRDTSSDEICSSDKVQEKEEEKEIISKTKIDERVDKDDIWIKLPEDETDKTYNEVKEVDYSSHAEDTSEITQHDGAKDIPKGNKNSTAKNEFLEDGCSNGSTESTTPIVNLVNADVEQMDKGIKAETVVTETGAASSALPITGVQCGPEETESEDSKTKETEMSLAPEGREYQGQHTKSHDSHFPPLSYVKDSEWEMAQKCGTENLQNGDDKNDDMKELDEGFVVISNERNFPEANSNENIEAEVTAGEKESTAIRKDSVSEFVVREIKEQPGKTVEAVPEEKGIKSEQGEIEYDDSDELKINYCTVETDNIEPSDILCSSISDAGQKAVGQETQIVVQEKEQKPGKGKVVETVPEEKGINTEEDEIKENDFSVLKENSLIVALDNATPVDILQGSTIDALRATGQETPEQHNLDEASLKEIEGGPTCITYKLTVPKPDQINNANFNSSVGSNKIPVLQHGDSSESSQTEGEKQKTSEPEKGGNCGNEETAKLMKTSESTEMDKPSQLGLLLEPVKEVSKVLDHLIDKKQPTTQEEEPQAEKSAEVEHVEAKKDEENDGEGESGEYKKSDLSSDNPVKVDAADKVVKVAHKKSHNILSGVGLKVKYSISKVKKAITGKSSHPKSASPKYAEKFK